MIRGPLATLALITLLAACTAPTSTTVEPADDMQTAALVGTWQSTGEPSVRVTYAADGTWRSVMSFVVDGDRHQFHGRGTWSVQDGVIHNTTLKHDPIPGMDKVELPYLSKEKLVAVGAEEYRYVCPVQGCTNTMRRVKD